MTMGTMVPIKNDPILVPLGVTPGISNEDYHADRSAVSSTQLKKILISPAHFLCALEDRLESDSSDALLFGQVLHARLLENETFVERFSPMPDIDRRSTEGKTIAHLTSKAVDGLIIFPNDWLARIDAMIANTRQHNAIREALAAGEAEIAFAWIDPETGVKCKVKLDWWHSPSLILDAKTAVDITPDGFAKACARYAYHLSAYMYTEGVFQVTGERPEWIFVALEKTPPYTVCAYSPSRSMLARGKDDFRKALRLLAQCRATGAFPPLQAEGKSRIVDLPRWF